MSRAPRAFYEQLGWKVTFTDGDIVMFQAGPMIVSLWSREQARRRQRRRRAGTGWGGFTLGYAVGGPEEVDALCAQAAEAGATVTRAPVDKGFGYSGVFADPDGHTWEIAWIKALDSATTTAPSRCLHDLGRAARLVPEHARRRGDLPVRAGRLGVQGAQRQDVRRQRDDGRAARHQRQVRPRARRSHCAASYEAIVEGYHLNKRHWITIALNADVPDDAGQGARRRTATTWSLSPRAYSPTPIASTGRVRSARRVGSARASSASSAETPRIAPSWSSGT